MFFNVTIKFVSPRTCLKFSSPAKDVGSNPLKLKNEYAIPIIIGLQTRNTKNYTVGNINAHPDKFFLIKPDLFFPIGAVTELLVFIDNFSSFR